MKNLLAGCVYISFHTAWTWRIRSKVESCKTIARSEFQDLSEHQNENPAVGKWVKCMYDVFHNGVFQAKLFIFPQSVLWNQPSNLWMNFYWFVGCRPNLNMSFIKNVFWGLIDKTKIPLQINVNSVPRAFDSFATANLFLIYGLTWRETIIEIYKSISKNGQKSSQAQKSISLFACVDDQTELMS